MAINSKRKGKVGELEAVHYLKEKGYENSRRSVQYSGKGNEDSADIVDAIPGVHLEIKRTEKCSPYKFLKQAIEDSTLTGKNDIPVVMHRQNRKDWIAIMQMDDLIKLLKKIESQEKLIDSLVKLP